MIDLGAVKIAIDHQKQTVTSIFSGTLHLVAAPQHDDESIARARALGYQGSDSEVVWKMTREHDLSHHLIAQARGQPYSRHLRRIARRTPLTLIEKQEGAEEERLVLLLQRVSNRGIGPRSP